LCLLFKNLKLSFGEFDEGKLGRSVIQFFFDFIPINIRCVVVGTIADEHFDGNDAEASAKCRTSEVEVAPRTLRSRSTANQSSGAASSVNDI